MVPITLGTYPMQTDHAHIHLGVVEYVQTRLQLHTADGEGGRSTLSTVGEQRGRERKGVGWGRDGHTMQTQMKCHIPIYCTVKETHTIIHPTQDMR